MRTFPENINPDLVIAFLCGETSTEETLLVKEWIASSDENKASFEALSKIWNASKDAFPEPADVNTQTAWQKLSNRIENTASEKNQIKKSNSFFIRYTLRVAAVLIPVIFAGYFMVAHFNKAKILSLVSTKTIIEKTLSDGSIVKLNKNSTLEYPNEFEDKTREIALNGEAFFTVTPNVDKPFIIHSGNIFIKVIGTSFNVNAYPDNEIINVYVKTGKVLLYTENNKGIKIDSAFLIAGDKGFYNRLTKQFEKITQSDSNDMFWINKTLVFDKTELSEVIKTLTNNYNVKIEVKNNELNKLHLSATFKDQSINSIIEIISTSLNLKIVKSGSTYIIDEEGN